MARHIVGVDLPSIAASNNDLASVKNFANGLVRSRRILETPFAHRQQLNAETDRRRERRAAGDDDFSKLLKAENSGRSFRGLTGEARSMLSLVATHTGIQISELASLTVG